MSTKLADSVPIFLIPGPFVCKVEDSTLISPFQSSVSGTRNYSFHAACEHILVSTCDTDPFDFTVNVDFITSDLDIGRVGVRLSNTTIVINENLNVTAINLGDPELMDGTSTSNISITQNPSQVEITLQEFGVKLIRVRNGTNTLYVNVTRGSASIKFCGLCGMLNGTLVYSDQKTTANSLDMEMFAESWRVNPNEQFLREHVRDCGELSISHAVKTTTQQLLFSLS